MTDPPLGLEKPLVAQVSDVAIPGVAGGLVDTTVDAGLELKTRSQWSYARTRFLRHRLAMGGLFGLILLFAAGIFANYLAPYPVDQIDLTKVLAAPTTVGHHFLGTDEIGRDFLSRIIFGIRTSEEVGVFVAVVASIIGLIVLHDDGGLGRVQNLPQFGYPTPSINHPPSALQEDYNFHHLINVKRHTRMK